MSEHPSVLTPTATVTDPHSEHDPPPTLDEKKSDSSSSPVTAAPVQHQHDGDESSTTPPPTTKTTDRTLDEKGATTVLSPTPNTEATVHGLAPPLPPPPPPPLSIDVVPAPTTSNATEVYEFADSLLSCNNTAASYICGVNLRVVTIWFLCVFDVSLRQWLFRRILHLLALFPMDGTSFNLASVILDIFFCIINYYGLYANYKNRIPWMKLYLCAILVHILSIIVWSIVEAIDLPRDLIGLIGNAEVDEDLRHTIYVNAFAGIILVYGLEIILHLFVARLLYRYLTWAKTLTLTWPNTAAVPPAPPTT